jgi:hypothetical protein
MPATEPPVVQVCSCEIEGTIRFVVTDVGGAEAFIEESIEQVKERAPGISGASDMPTFADALRGTRRQPLMLMVQSQDEPDAQDAGCT